MAEHKNGKGLWGKDLLQQKAEKVPVIHTSFTKIYNFFSRARNPRGPPPYQLPYSAHKPAAKQEGYGYCAPAKLNKEQSVAGSVEQRRSKNARETCTSCGSFSWAGRGWECIESLSLADANLWSFPTCGQIEVGSLINSL